MRYFVPFLILLTVGFAGCTSDDAPDQGANGTAAQIPSPQPTAPGIANANANANVNESQNEHRPSPAPTRRNFKFLYAGTITDLTPGATARIWLPEATSSESQTIKRTAIDLPAEHQETSDEEFGNKLIYFEATANDKGEIPFSVEYEVERLELLGGTSPKALAMEKYLRPNTLVPTDRALLDVVFKGADKPVGETREIARALYDQIGSRMKYDKPAGGEWGRGDAVWACDSRYGNCTDFHSLFIALCRESKIPSYFEIGFPISADKKKGEVDGYHCWALFSDDGKWIPVDISEADKHAELTEYYFGNLTANRVAFTRGRDLVLKPASAAKSINFLVYPHIEVDGKVHRNFRKGFRYEDI